MWPLKPALKKQLMVSGFLKRFWNVFFQVKNTGCFNRVVVADNHSGNKNAFNISRDKFEGDKKY